MLDALLNIGFRDAFESGQELVNVLTVIRFNGKTVMKEYSQADHTVAERDGIPIEVCACSKPSVDKAVFVTLAVIQNVLIGTKR